MQTLMRALVFSDVHLGHPSTPTSLTIESIQKNIWSRLAVKAINAIIFPGDLINNLLYLNNPVVEEIDAFMISTLHLAKANDISIIVLEGTPGHDRNQSKRFVTLNESCGIGADVLYVDKLDILYLEKFKMNVLFMPDKWPPHAAGAYEQVLEKLAEKNLEQVDMAIMHGCFHFQLPIQSTETHCEEDYLRIVKGPIIIGHDHTHKVWQRIIIPGSTDRLKHAEEEPKGFLHIQVFDDFSFDWDFIENKDAKIYKTVRCEGLTFEEAERKIHKEVNDLPATSHVRIITDKHGEVADAIKIVTDKYPFLVFKHEFPKPESCDNQIQVMNDKNWEYVPVLLTKDSINDTLMKAAAEKFQDADMVSLVKEILNRNS